MDKCNKKKFFALALRKMGGVCTYVTSLDTSESYILLVDWESPLLSLWYVSPYHKTNIYTKRMRRLLSVRVWDCSSIAADSLAPTESINFISLWQDSITDEGYNLSQVVMFTFITMHWYACI